MQAKEFYEHLTKGIIPFWNRMKDEENGGFYGYADAEGVPDKSSDKGVLLTCRILWFYSAAYSFVTAAEAEELRKNKTAEAQGEHTVPGAQGENAAAQDENTVPGAQGINAETEELLQMADHAYRFFRDCCCDREKGGVFWTVKADGSPADTTKYTYNMAFAIYALSAYYKASGNGEALETAYDLFGTIETICKDEKGYLEAFDKNFVPVVNEALSENGVTAERTMNTLLHLLESYTEFYRVDRSDAVGERLKEILEAFRTVVYNPKEKRCEVFFDDDFHSLIDLESYGHDIETSWLIDRACEVLEDEEVTAKMMPVIKGLAEGALEKGIDPESGALNYENDRGNVKRTKNWWPQAEATIGFYNAYQHGFSSAEITGEAPTKTAGEGSPETTGEIPEETAREITPESYRTAAEKVWDFVCSHVIDKAQGEWIEDVEADGSIKPGQALVHLWKCPYHTGRVCMEMARRLK